MTVGIVGLGLIGGSFAKAYHEAGERVLAQDIDRMEQLGIYEVVPEDMALCEFVCTSKTPVQKILSDGIELMMKETN